MNVLSLFDGISCAQIALERANIKVNSYFASEIDKNAIKVTQYHYPNTIQLGDVRQINGSDLPKINLLIGGSPCQGFSIMGKGLNFNDPRSKLFFEFVRLLKECQPKYFLLENIKMRKKWLDIISEHVKVNPILINSDLISAQYRRRNYWTNIPNIIQPLNKNLMIKDIVDIESNYEYLDDWETISRCCVCKLGVSFDFRIPMDESMYRRACYLNNKHITITCGGNPYILCKDNRIRKTTLLEQERLQTLPDNYTNIICKTARHKCIGNCFTVNVITHILKGI